MADENIYDLDALDQTVALAKKKGLLSDISASLDLTEMYAIAQEVNARIRNNNPGGEVKMPAKTAAILLYLGLREKGQLDNDREEAKVSEETESQG